MRTLLPTTIRSLKLAAVSTAVAASALTLAPSALAAPVPAASPVGAQYAGAGCTAGISVQVVVQGGSVSITVICSGGVTVVSVVVNSTPVSLPVVAADANGRSTYTVDTASLPVGDHNFTVTYSDGTTQVLPFTVTRPQASGVPAGSGSSASGGGLAFTGAGAVVPLGAVGAVLVLGGAGAYVAARKRRDETAA